MFSQKIISIVYKNNEIVIIIITNYNYKDDGKIIQNNATS